MSPLSLFLLLSALLFSSALTDYSLFSSPNARSRPQHLTLIPPNINGETGTIFSSADAAKSYFGLSVTGIGDINDDGVDDIAIGTYGPQPVYVIFGKKGWSMASFNVTQLNGANGFMLTSRDDGENFGYTVSGIGDFNGDSIDDMAIGAPWASPSGFYRAGKVYVLFGRDSATPFPKTVEVSSLSVGECVVYSGYTSKQMVGISLGRCDDVTHDGISDLVIGAESTAFVLFGQTNVTSFSLKEIAAQTGFSVFQPGGRIIVSGAGDVDADDVQDLIFGAPYVGVVTQGPDSRKDWKGEAYVIFGSKEFPFTSPLNLASIPPSVGFTMTGFPEGGQFGVSVGSAKDVNGDGYDDFIVGSSLKTSTSLLSRAFVVFGGGDRDSYPGLFSLPTLLNGMNGFRMDVEDVGDMDGEWDSFYIPTISVSTIGSINGDQYDDVALGVPYADHRQGDFVSLDVGKVYVLFGRPDFEPVISLQYDLSGGGFVLVGGEENAKAGASVQYIGDFNHDDIDDFILGAPSTHGTSSDITFVGTVYTIYGGERLSHLKASLVLSRTLGLTFASAMLIVTAFLLAYRYRFHADESPIPFTRVSQREERDGEGEEEGKIGIEIGKREEEEEEEENDDDILLSDD